MNKKSGVLKAQRIMVCQQCAEDGGTPTYFARPRGYYSVCPDCGSPDFAQATAENGDDEQKILHIWRLQTIKRKLDDVLMNVHGNEKPAVSKILSDWAEKFNHKGWMR